MYDYRQTVFEDVKGYLWENKEIWYGKWTLTQIEQFLRECCFTEDSVTGNASGSYTFSRSEALRYLQEDSNVPAYIGEMINADYVTGSDLARVFRDNDWEWLDVSLRCYLLDDAVYAVVRELEEEGC